MSQASKHLDWCLNKAKSEKLKIQILEIYIPVLFGIIGLVLLGYEIYLMRKKT